MRNNSLVSKILKRTILALALLFLGVQVVRPAKTNPPVDQTRTLEANAQVTPEVGAILKRACSDCHSNETSWPWYSDVAPVSWFVIDHVNHGRRHLNFSNWADYAGADANDLLGEIAKTVKEGAMPLESYTMIHSEAKLSDRERRMIVEWAQAERSGLAYRSR